MHEVRGFNGNFVCNNALLPLKYVVEGAWKVEHMFSLKFDGAMLPFTSVVEWLK